MYNQATYRTVLFWQEHSSRSKFDPRPGTCHFEVDFGSFLYAHAPDSVDKGCEKIISRHALIFPKGTALFIVAMEDHTTVGVLGSPSAPVTIQNKKPKQGPVELKAGEYVTALEDGTLQQGEFSLAGFYKQYKLGLGLANSPADDAYVLRQELPIQDILNRIRKETVTALNEQPPKPEIPDDLLESFPVDARGRQREGGDSGGVAPPPEPPPQPPPEPPPQLPPQPPPEPPPIFILQPPPPPPVN